jgi:predicted GH43/DUF377 family glycosyl hydrolase
MIPRSITALLAASSFALPSTARVVQAQVPSKLRKWLGPQKWVRDTPDAVLKLGPRGSFDDTHIMAPLVKRIGGRYVMLYVGSSGSAYDLAPRRMPDNRVYRLGLATSQDGKQFQKHPRPVAELKDARRSFLTPTVLSNADGTLIKENGKYRMWFCSATLGGGGRPHAVQHAVSDDGVHWSKFSKDLITRAYCPVVIKDGGEYRMWYSEPGRYPWVVRHARSKDGFKWAVDRKPAIEKTQKWEHYVFNYAKVLKVDGVYLMWYTSYASADRLTTAIGFAASEDGLTWHKHPQNPVFEANPKRAWESNYVSSGTIMRMKDGSFRMWYFARKKPPFKNLYDAFGTATWKGPAEK